MLFLTVGCTHSQEASTSKSMTAEVWQKKPAVCSEIIEENQYWGIINDLSIYQNNLAVSVPNKNYLVIYTLDDNKQSLNSQVINLPPDENGSFKEFAINENYLIVGYPRSNRVVVYRPNSQGTWSKTKEIFPPKNSVAAKVGFGFGQTLALEDELLVIGATYSSLDRINFGLENVNEPKVIGDFKWMAYGNLYQTRLDRDTEIESIDVDAKQAIWGSSVTLDRGRIAFNTLRSNKNRKQGYFKWISEVNLLLPDGSLKTILPPKDPQNNPGFGLDIAFNDNLLLIGSPDIDGFPAKSGGAWLYDLNLPEAKPQLFTTSKAIMGDALALSEDFLAIGSSASGMYIASDERQKTLVRRLDNGKTTVMDGVGFLSIKGNILLRKQDRSPDFEIKSILEVFELDEQAKAHLLERLINVDDASLENGLLGTVGESRNGKRVCLKQLS